MEDSMAKAETKVPVTTESKPESPLTATQMQTWRPFENLRREVDRLFEDFTLSPFRLQASRSGALEGDKGKGGSADLAAQRRDRADLCAQADHSRREGDRRRRDYAL